MIRWANGFMVGCIFAFSLSLFLMPFYAKCIVQKATQNTFENVTNPIRELFGDEVQEDGK